MKNGNQIKPSTYIIIAFAVLSLVIIGIIVVVYNLSNSSESGDTNQNERVDKTSGETVLDPANKSPEKYGVNKNMPIFIGFSELYDRGMGQSDIEAVKATLNDYAAQQLVNKQPKITEVSLNKTTVNHSINRDTGESTYTVDVVVNQKDTRKVTITSGEDITKLTISLYSKDTPDPLFTAVKDVADDNAVE